MKGFRIAGFCVLSLCFILAGCVVRTYESTRDRVDQSLNSGNRGYLKGSVPQNMEPQERKTTRTTRVVEIELHSPVKFESKSKMQKTPAPVFSEPTDQEVTGNRGYITQSVTPEMENAQTNYQKYTVQKNDTLQKISQKFFGTTKKWTKIYDANKGVMKGPNKIYPGQVINIPTEGESFKETQENLK